MQEYTVVEISDNKWKNTVWKSQIIPVEIRLSKYVPNYGYRHSVLVNGKVLGLIALGEENLPVGSVDFASIETQGEYVKVKLVDKPIDWLCELKDSENDELSQDFLDSMGWQEESIHYYETEDTALARLSDLEDGVTPQYFYEWLIRMGLNEKNITVETVEDYLGFRSWLIRTQKISESQYGDEEIQAYKEKCDEQRRIAKAEQEALDYADDYLWEKQRIEDDYGRGARIDEYGAVFNDDGECIGIE
jgi:hypothetical protein